MDPSWGDILQATTTMIVAIVFGIVIDRRYTQKNSIKHIFCRELASVNSQVERVENRIAVIYDQNQPDFGAIRELILDNDATRKRVETLRKVVTGKLNHDQLTEFDEFYAAYVEFDFILKSLGDYFDQNRPEGKRDARIDIAIPSRTIMEAVVKIEMLAG